MFADTTSRIAVRAAACAGSLALCFALTGCSLFKQSSKEPAAPQAGGGVPPPKFPTGDPLAPNAAAAANNNVTPTNGVTNSANQGAILAGRVIDGFSRPPTNTSIRWVSLDDKKETENEVSVTPEGYFTIQGLKPGSHYKLLARGKQGERLVAGISYTTAPNIRVLIQVKDELANANTPPVPGAPVASPQNESSKTSALGANQPPNGWSPIPNAANEPDLPVAISINSPPRAQPSLGAPAQDWTPAPGAQMSTWPPTLEIPRANKTVLPSLQIPNSPPPATPSVTPVISTVPPPPPLTTDFKSPPVFPAKVADALSQARVPSCVLVGDRIVNFALNDVNGEPWELRRRTGKLVLIDFWRSDCIPCLNTMPYLADLQAKYRTQGLEVIGIANESGLTAQEQAYRAMGTCKRLGVNYRQLLSAGPTCPVRNELRISVVPTLILIDDQGRILWREDGSPSPERRGELERLIQQRLTTRAF